MPANHSSMDLLSKSLGQNNGPKGDRLVANKSEKQQGDSFKTVIDRSQQSGPAERADQPKAAPDADSKQNNNVKLDAGKEAKSENPKQPVKAESGVDSPQAPQQTELTADQRDLDGTLAVEGEQQLSLLPTAAPVLQDGNTLPPPENGQLNTPVAISQIAKSLAKPVTEEIARAMSQLPRGSESREHTSSETIERFRQAVQQPLDLTSGTEATAAKTSTPSEPLNVDPNIPAAPATTITNKTQSGLMLDNENPITLSADAIEGAEIFKQEPAVKAPEVKWQPTPQQPAAVNSPNHAKPEITATQTEQLILDKTSATLASETAADKAAATASTPESGGTVKLSSSSMDQQWLQQIQSMQTLAAQGKANGNNVQMQLPLNIHNPQWFAAMADRVSWLASQSIQAADIQLDPPELGPLQVRIAVNNDQASVNFISHQATVRDTLDSQLMRLRELFESEGMNLVDVNVSDREQQQQDQDAEGGRGSGANGLLDNNIDNEAPSIIPVNTIRNWVDYYV